MRESYIERRTSEIARAHGWEVRKWKSVNYRGVPDKIFYREGEIRFVEFKAPGKKPNQLQNKEICKLRRHGFEVYVIDNVVDGMALFNE